MRAAGMGLRKRPAPRATKPTLPMSKERLASGKPVMPTPEQAAEAFLIDPQANLRTALDLDAMEWTPADALNWISSFQALVQAQPLERQSRLPFPIFLVFGRRISKHDADRLAALGGCIFDRDLPAYSKLQTPADVENLLSEWAEERKALSSPSDDTSTSLSSIMPIDSSIQASLGSHFGDVSEKDFLDFISQG
jgi:hypothetical protein